MRIYFEVAVPELTGSFDAHQIEGGWEFHVQQFPNQHDTGHLRSDSIEPFDIIRLALNQIQATAPTKTVDDLEALPLGSVIQTVDGVLEKREAVEYVGAAEIAEYLAWFDTDAAEYSSAIVSTNGPIRVLSVGPWNGKA